MNEIEDRPQVLTVTRNGGTPGGWIISFSRFIWLIVQTLMPRAVVTPHHFMSTLNTTAASCYNSRITTLEYKVDREFQIILTT